MNKIPSFYLLIVACISILITGQGLAEGEDCSRIVQANPTQGDLVDGLDEDSDSSGEYLVQLQCHDGITRFFQTINGEERAYNEQFSIPLRDVRLNVATFKSLRDNDSLTSSERGRVILASFGKEWKRNLNVAAHLKFLSGDNAPKTGPFISYHGTFSTIHTAWKTAVPFVTFHSISSFAEFGLELGYGSEEFKSLSRELDTDGEGNPIISTSSDKMRTGAWSLGFDATLNVPLADNTWAVFMSGITELYRLSKTEQQLAQREMHGEFGAGLRFAF
jgi:hypothetical protein